MSYLKYDTDKMFSVKLSYDIAVNDLETLKNKMQAMVDSVKEGWDTDAGKAFFEKYNDEWLKGFNQYKEVLGHMSENLNVAKGKYTEVTNLAKKTTLKC